VDRIHGGGQMSTALDIDLELMVGEMEYVPCESLGHGNENMHEGHATHYARITCPFCDVNKIKAYCAPFITYVTGGGLVRCSDCGAGHAGHTGHTGHTTILGPVGGTK
jgi:hypothetical protein